MEEEIIIDLTDEEEIIIDEEDMEEVSVEDNIERIYLDNYNPLKNKPSIEGVTLIGNKTFENLGATSLSNMEIENLINMQI